MTAPSTRGRIAPPVATGASSGAGRDSHSRPVAAGNLQRLVIEGWLPAALANGSHGHWNARNQKLRVAQQYVYFHAKALPLTPIKGRARVTVTLVFPQNRRRDTDNLYARIKGCVDGLVKGGWIEDDDTEHLVLEVRAEVRPGVKQTEILLEGIS